MYTSLRGHWIALYAIRFFCFVLFLFFGFFFFFFFFFFLFITKTCLFKYTEFLPSKNENFEIKILIFFFIFLHKT